MTKAKEFQKRIMDNDLKTFEGMLELLKNLDPHVEITVEESFVVEVWFSDGSAWTPHEGPAQETFQ